MAIGDIQDQVGLIGNKLGSFTENQGVDVAPPSSVLETTDWFGPTKTLARGIGEANAMYGTVDDYGRQTSASEEYVDPKTLNEKFSLPNHPAFDKAMPMSVAQGIYDHRVDQDKIADAIERRPDGFWHGAARYGTQFVADALDPLNLAAMFVPGVGEAKFVAEGAGTLAKIGGRAAAGAINADIGQIPLIGLKYGQSKFEQDDYNAYNAMADLATGAGMGALFHAGIGAFADRLQSRVARSAEQKALEADPGLRESSLKTALAQQLSDNDVEVRPVFDAAGLKAATDTRDALLDEAANVTSIAPGSKAALRIAEIDEELGGGQRLAAIDQELNGAIDPARRAKLEAERELVTANQPGLERVGALMKEREQIVALEDARSVAQQEGLVNAAERSEAEITAHLHAKNAEHYGELEKMVKEAGGTVAEAYAATASHGDASLEELERAYQQTRSARAESQSAAAGQRPNAPAANQAAGAAGVVDQQRAAQSGAAGTEAGGAGQGAGSAGGAGATAPASPVAAGGADWLAHNAAEAVTLAQKLGVTNTIRDLANAGKTAKEISEAIGGKLDAVEVRAVRDSLGIAPAGPTAVGFTGVSIPQEPSDTTGFIKAFSGMAGAMSDTFKRDAWNGMERGDKFWLTDPVVMAAKKEMDRGSIKNRADFDRYVDYYFQKLNEANKGSPAQVGTPVGVAQQEALRAADGKPTATQQKVTEAAAMAGKTPVQVDKLVKAAADQIQDHLAFFQNAEAMGALTDADRAAMQALGKLEEESNGLRSAAGQAAMCIARGLG